MCRAKFKYHPANKRASQGLWGCKGRHQTIRLIDTGHKKDVLSIEKKDRPYMDIRNAILLFARQLYRACLQQAPAEPHLGHNRCNQTM